MPHAISVLSWKIIDFNKLKLKKVLSFVKMLIMCFEECIKTYTLFVNKIKKKGFKECSFNKFVYKNRIAFKG